ncbi:MAG: hypothetical protein D6755_09920, partial [Anaerolineae bacterium]
GEFSLAVVDKAVLALADPNSLPITQAFYGNQPLGVRTGLGLAAYLRRGIDSASGLGGGGGGALEQTTAIRENFPDTAYWQADIRTDANGEALVTFETPDNLTTWVLDLRGVTRDTLVGAAQTELVVNKPLLLRPVTPRFVTLGDHLPLAAIVHNNTTERLEVTVQLQAPAFQLDDPAQRVQVVTLEPGTRTRVDWWGVVTEADTLEVLFSAQAGRLSDATRPANGALPIVRYSAPQTFATGGVLDSEGATLETISLSPRLSPLGGSVQVELAPSLAAAMLPTLDALEHQPYECTEQTVARFLPNLAAYRALSEFGLSSPDVEDRLQRTLDAGIHKLQATQHEDGGWGWWGDSVNSNPYITTYVLFALLQAREAGVQYPQASIEQAAAYLGATMLPLNEDSAPHLLEREAFALFVLQQAGKEYPLIREMLYKVRARLSPAAQAFLALSYPPDSEQSALLLSDLQRNAVRSATGAHWEAGEVPRRILGSDVHSTAVVVYALAQREP